TLEFMPGPDLHRDAELVERAAQEDPLDSQSGQPDVTRRLQENCLERSRQVVGQVAGRKLTEGLRPGERRLARFAESQHGVAQFLHDAESDRAAAELDDQRL